MEQIPTWAIALIGALGVIMIVFYCIASVFIISYLFFWEKMKMWFNKKAGAEFMPEKRIERPQLIAGVIGVILAVVIAIAGATGVSAESLAQLTPMSIILGVIQWGGLIWFVIYCRKTYRQKVANMGKQGARWSTIYLLCSCTTIVMLSVMLSTYVMMVYAALFIFDKGWNFSFSNTKGNSSGGNVPTYKCCTSCRKYSFLQCSETPGVTISDPDHHSCSSHTF